MKEAHKIVLTGNQHRIVSDTMLLHKLCAEAWQTPNKPMRATVPQRLDAHTCATQSAAAWLARAPIAVNASKTQKPAGQPTEPPKPVAEQTQGVPRA